MGEPAADGSRADRDGRPQRPRLDLARRRRRAYAELAAAQHGQLAHRDLAACGVDADARRRLVDAGELVRRHAGVVAVAGFAPGLHADAMAAVLAGGPGALLCCVGAAALFDAGRRPEGSLCVTVPRGARRRRTEVRFHERTRLPEADLHFGIPVTRPAQIALDCACLLDADALDRLVDDLVAGRRVTMDQLDAHAAAARGQAGVIALRSSLALAAGGVTRSEAEQRLRRLLGEAGIGPVELNAEVLGRHRDAWFSDARVVVEVQTLRYHGTPARMDDDARRALELQEAGIEAVAVTARMLRDAPAPFLAQLAAIVARRTPSADSEPAGHPAADR